LSRADAKWRSISRSTKSRAAISTCWEILKVNVSFVVSTTTNEIPAYRRNNLINASRNSKLWAQQHCFYNRRFYSINYLRNRYQKTSHETRKKLLCYGHINWFFFFHIIFFFLNYIFMLTKYKIFIIIYYILNHNIIVFYFWIFSEMSPLSICFQNICIWFYVNFRMVSSSWGFRYFLLLHRERAVKERPHLRGEKMTKIRVMVLVVIRCGDIFGVHTFIEKSLNGCMTCGRARRCYVCTYVHSTQIRHNNLSSMYFVSLVRNRRRTDLGISRSL